MVRNDHEAVVRGYLAYLAHNRESATEPGTHEEAVEILRTLERRPAESPYRDAWEPADDLIRSDPEAAWQLLLQSISQCHEDDLALIGAGLLEHFMWRRGLEFLERVLAEIRVNPRLRTAFAAVYLGADFPEPEGRLINSTLISSGLSPASTIDWWSSD